MFPKRQLAVIQTRFTLNRSLQTYLSHARTTKMTLAPDAETLSSRYLWIERRDEKISISYKLTPSMTLGSKVREKDLRRRLKDRLHRWSPQKILDAGEVVTAYWPTANLERAKSAILYVDQMLDAFRKERIIPKIVEEVLGIGASERRRWIKDGRLPTSGTGQFKKGKTVFQFHLHRADDIARLIAHPEIIAEWRAADGETAD